MFKMQFQGCTQKIIKNLSKVRSPFPNGHHHRNSGENDMRRTCRTFHLNMNSRFQPTDDHQLGDAEALSPPISVDIIL